MVAVGEQERERPQAEIRCAAIVVLQVTEQRRDWFASLAAGLVTIEHRCPAVAVADLARARVGIDAVDEDVLDTAGLHFFEHVCLYAFALFVVQHQGVHARIIDMCGRAVIALLVIFYREFPVCCYIVFLMRGNLEILETEHRHRLRELPLGATQRRRRIRKTHDKQTVDDVDGHSVQSVAGFVEVFGHVTRRNQLAFDVVHPAVIRTREFLLVAFRLETDQRPAMATHVRKRVDRAIFRANDDRRLVRNLEYFEVPWVRQLRFMPGKNPVFANDLLELELVYRGIRIKPLLQRVPGFLTGNQLRNGSRIRISPRRTHHSLSTM